MLKRKLRKNVDLIVFLLFVTIVYAGGWQAEVFGFVQRGILAIGLFDAAPKHEIEEKPVRIDFKLYDEEGNIMEVAQLKGKTVFINIWASWCPPCIAEMPGINKLYQRFKDDPDISFLMISADEEQEKALSLYRRKEFDFPIYFPVSKLPSALSYKSIPSTFVISPAGYIAYRKEGMASYDHSSFYDFLEKL